MVLAGLSIAVLVVIRVGFDTLTGKSVVMVLLVCLRRLLMKAFLTDYSIFLDILLGRVPLCLLAH